MQLFGTREGATRLPQVGRASLGIVPAGSRDPSPLHESLSPKPALCLPLAHVEDKIWSPTMLRRRGEL